MSESIVQLSDWPAHVIARADSLAMASAPLQNESAASVRDMVIELSGDKGPKQLPHLLRFLAARLSLPDLAVTNIDTAQLSIARRLTVIAKAQRRVTLALSEPESLAPDLLDFLLSLIAKTELRLLLIGPTAQTQRVKSLTKSAGLGWVDLGQAAPAPSRSKPAPATPRDAPPSENAINNRRIWAVAGAAAVALGCGALWYSSQAENLQPQVTQVAPIVISDAARENPTEIPTEIPTETPPENIPEPLNEPEAQDDIDVTPAPAPPATLAAKPASRNLAAAEAGASNKPLFPAGTRYTIQIASYKRADFRQEFMKKNGSDLAELRSVDIDDGDKRKMLVVYGAFSGYTAAREAATSLPGPINLGNPYVIEVNASMVLPSQERSD